jgi:branched-chain amino acid aminotransferase
MSIPKQINDVKVAIACWQWSGYAGNANQGIKVRTSSWVRNPDHALPPTLKTTGGYINASLARLEATRSDCHEAIMLNIHGRIAEGTASNVFIVMESNLITPPLSEGILPGITRDSVLAIAKQINMSVIEKTITPIDLQIASEVILAGTAIELKPVAHLNGTQLRTERPFFELLNAKFQLAIHGKLETKTHWSELIHQSS